jgi:glyoxylase-like metal-dependent hydrolase (beta-lactamase superfamily II)
MYRHGLGDCFLITLPRKASPDPYRILIDCGVILGTANASDTMTKVVDDIVRESNGMIDLLILTHQHWDHLSGFVQA